MPHRTFIFDGGGGGGIALTDAHEYCIDMGGAGSAELLRDLTAVGPWGIRPNFSIGLWFYPGANFNSQTGDLFAIGGADDVIIRQEGGGANDPLEILLYDNNSLKKDWRWNNLFATQQWYFLVVTWNNTTETIDVYVNGVDQGDPDTKSTDDTCSLSDISANAGLGVNPAWTNLTNWRIHTCVTWNSVLTGAEILALYNGGKGDAIDYATDGGNYSSSANLTHWWKLGYDADPESDMGKDYQGAEGINWMDDSNNITAADDRINDSPGS